MNETLITVGEIANTQGIRGELKVVSHSDFAEQRFAKGSRLIIVDAKGEQTPVVVQTSRVHKKLFFLTFKEFQSIGEVEKFKGALLKVESRYQDELGEDEYYYHEIIGCEVVTEDGESLGTISEILTPGANDVWVVKRPKGKELLLPVIDEVVLKVDIEAKRVVVELMEGLLDE